MGSLGEGQEEPLPGVKPATDGDVSSRRGDVVVAFDGMVEIRRGETAFVVDISWTRGDMMKGVDVSSTRGAMPSWWRS